MTKKRKSTGISDEMKVIYTGIGSIPGLECMTMKQLRELLKMQFNFTCETNEELLHFSCAELQ